MASGSTSGMLVTTTMSVNDVQNIADVTSMPETIPGPFLIYPMHVQARLLQQQKIHCSYRLVDHD